MASYKHIIITRYSVTNLRSPVQSWFRNLDVMDEARLRLRLQVFKFATFPSIANQLDQDFDWIILIDSQLPGNHRSELESLIRQRPRTHIVTHDPRIKVWRGQWIRDRFNDANAPILTTLLDDDDALPSNFTDRMRHLLQGALSVEVSMGPRVFAYYDVDQWDLRFDNSTPLGVKAPWHRRRYNNTRYPSACGLSLLIPNRYYDLSVLSIPHVNADLIFNTDFEARDRDAKNAVRLLRRAARQAGDDWRDWSTTTQFKSLDELMRPAVLINHHFNDQEQRLHEQKWTVKRVTGPETFPDIALDWEAIALYAGIESEH